MTDSTGTLSETHSSSSNEPTETQLAETGDKVQVTEPALGTTIQVVAAGDSLQLNFDPADVAKVEMKDGNLEVTFKNGGVAVIQGYEEWASAGGQPTGPQGGVVDVAHLAQPGQTNTAEGQAPACEIPNAHVVDVPVPAEGERLTLAVAPGDALRLACSFRDVHGTEAGHNLEMTFPGGGVVVVENFSEWIAAKGATISDCVCGGVNPAEFIIALGLNPEDVLPAADGEGPAGALPDSVIFAPGQPPQILHSYDHPHILPPTALGYGAPNPEETFEPIKHNDLGGPVARDDNPNAELNVLTVHETTDAAPILLALAAASGGGEGGENGGDEGCVGPIGPQVFHPDQTKIQVLNNDSFGPDKGGNPPITAFHYTGDPSLVDNPNGVLVLDPAGDKLVITSTDPNPDENQWHAELIIDGPHAGEFTFFLDSTYLHDPVQGQNDAFQHFSYTIQDSTGDKASANITVDIVDSVPVANNDCAVCITEGGEGGAVIPVDATAALVDGHIVGNVMANDDKGADQFLPDGTKLITFTYTADDGEGHAVSKTADAGQTVDTFLGGHLTVNADGSWTYTPPAEVDNSNGDPHDDFTYTIKDGDGDTSSATQPICIQDRVEPPDVTMTIGVNGQGACVEEDSLVNDPDNKVQVHAAAQGDDVLTQLVITGFNQEPGWAFNFNGMTQQGVTGVVYNAGAGTVTVTFGPHVTHFDGAFGVQPPANTDVDLGTLTATATAAAADDPTNTLDSNTTLDVTVDAVADKASFTIDVNDSGDSNSTFQSGETGTVHVTATFGDFTDGSELHTVSVNVPDGFTLGALDGLPNGVTATVNGNDVVFTVGTGIAGLDYTFNVTNTSAPDGGPYTFSGEAKAQEQATEAGPNGASGDECDNTNNVATADAHEDTTVTNVGTPTITVDLRSTDACIEEDSATATDENQVDLVAHAQTGDVLVNLVVTGFDPGTVVGTGGSQPTWLIDISALTADTTHVASAVYNTGTDTLTITFKPGVTDFTGSFSVAPPKDSDVDLGTLLGTVKAADASDPTLTATSNSSTIVNVDANADIPTVTVDANDGGDAGTTFQQNETGTVHVTATFGDFQDGSEVHTVLVDVPDGFTVGALGGLPAGVTAQIVDGNNVLFTVPQGTGSLDYTFNVTNTAGGTGDATFTATATAHEKATEAGPNGTSGEECDDSAIDNTKSVSASDNPGRQDDTPTIVPASVTVDDDDTPGFNGGATDTVDPPNASATANLNANFGVDAPGTVIFGTNPNPTVTSHGEAITYTQSADHKTLTATADAGGPDQHVVYTAVINNDGTYTFTLLDALDHTPGGGENDLGLSFAVTATDKDGDSTGGTINVTVNDDSPISTGGATGTVEEDNLPGGHDENAGINLTTTGSIGINFGADGPGNVTTISYTGPALTSGGAAVTFGAFDPATHSITASAGGHTVFTVSINPTTGQYTFTLAGPLDHPAGGGDEQAKNLTFGFTATDFDGDPVNGNFAVDVRDDVPLAANDPVDTSGAAQTINIMIVFDKSGSMDEDPNVNGYSTRIDLARAAVAALLDTYGSFANVNVQIVDFSTDATAHGWMTIDQANAFLATLTAGGTTDYHDALTTAATAFNTNTPDADRSVVYFLSDGKPTADNGADSQLGAADITTWQTFAHNDSIEQVFAIGIGNGIPANDANLEGVAFLDANHDGVKDGNSSVVVTENLLLDTLVSTVSSTVSGNVLTNDQFGADGAGAPKVTEIVIGTHHLNSATAAGNLGDIQVLANAAGIIVVHTGLGGDLTFNFNTGDFTYHAPNTNNDETFQYTIVDKDGDTSTADLTFLNTAVTDEKPHTVFGDNGNNNLNGQETAGIDIIGGDDGNDTASGGLGNDHITGGAGADNLSGGGDNDIIIGGSRSEVTDQPGVTRADDGNDTLHGDAGNDTLIGNEGDDILQGGAGNDSIIGGPGNDLIDWSDATGAINHTLGASGTGSANLASVGLGTDSYSSIQGIIGSNFADTLTGNASDNTLQGGHGDDVLDGGGGNDTFNYTSVLDGHDVINNFDSNNTGGTDVLNLDALFDSLGLATANRHVSIAGSGTTTVEVNADTNNDGTFDLHVATLHTVDTGAVAVGTEILVGTA